MTQVKRCGVSFYTWIRLSKLSPIWDYRLVLEREQTRDQAKSISFKLYLWNFFYHKLNKRNPRSLLEFSLIDMFQYFIAMEAPPHVYTEAPLNILGFHWARCSKEYSLIFLKYFWSRFKVYMTEFFYLLDRIYTVFW